MKLALAQYALSADIAQNLAKTLALMESASQRGAQFILFPEVCLSPFFPQYAGQDVSRYVMNIDDPSIRQFQAACRRLKLAASPNVYLQEGGQRFDASLMIGADGEIQGISKMVHIAQVPCFYEQDYYTPSDTGFRVYDTPFGKIGIVVCFDRHYPESVRTCALRGAELVLIPTANTMGEPLDLFECEVRTAALQNCVNIAMCNRVGAEGEVVFCGESIVVDANGKVIGKSGQAEDLLIVDVDLPQAVRARNTRPYLSLRRPELYE